MADIGWILREHIAKEDGVLFPFADRTLSPERAAELADGMRRIESASWGIVAATGYAVP